MELAKLLRWAITSKINWNSPERSLRLSPRKRELVSIRWDNGGVEVPLKAAEEFALISRNGS
jgi:hypothetical protein